MIKKTKKIKMMMKMMTRKEKLQRMMKLKTMKKKATNKNNKDKIRIREFRSENLKKK